ncbi:unnamed protein product [Diamesa serratosioi]
MQSLEDDDGGIEGYIKKIDKFLHGKDEIENNTEHDFSQPIVREALEKYLPFLFCLYGLLMVIGVTGNIVLIAYIVKQKLYYNETHGFIINLALCQILQCSFVLPITILIIVLQNWIFGQFLCFFVPMLQDIPIHVLVITNVMLAWDRLRWLRDPFKIRLPSFVCGCGTWLTGIIIALPYPIYTTYIDLGTIFPERYHGVGVCAVNILDDKLDEYMRTLFVVMYFAPSVVLSFIYIRSATELQSPRGPLAVMMFETKAELCYTQSKNKCRQDRMSKLFSKTPYNLCDDQMNLTTEQRTQRHLSGISASHFICLCPLMILRLARMNVPETYENTLHYDLCFLMFIWISLLPTIITPIIFFSWMLSRPTKVKLKSFFRFSHTRNNTLPKMEFNVNDENTSIKPTEFYAPENVTTLNSQRKRDNTKETIFDDCCTSDMSNKSFKSIQNIRMTKTVNNELTDDDAINHDTKCYYASTSSTSCSLHEENDVSTYYNKSCKHSNYQNSKVMAAKPTREFKSPIDSEIQHDKLKKCLSASSKDIEIITYLARDRTLNFRDVDKEDKYNFESNKRLSQLPNRLRRESGASNSSTRYLISNNSSPVLISSIIPSKNTIECSYNPNNTHGSIILENYSLHSNTFDNDLIEECRYENSRTNFQSNSKEHIRHYKTRSYAENDKFTQI